METGYEDYLALIQRAQAELLDTIDELRTLEEWDAECVAGLRRWAADESMVYRALKRYRYDLDKTSHQLLQTITQRVNLSLHSPIPAVEPYASSSLFHFLSLPKHTDRAGRPIAVLNLSEVARDETGTLDGLKEWAWWMAEYSRRVVCDWENAEAALDEAGNMVNPWDGRRKARPSRGGGTKGNGYTLIVNVTGVGYRHLELELVPTLLNIGHGHFPGLISKVMVVNLSWSQKYLWGVIQRVLPKYALDKIWFPASSAELGSVVDLALLPEALGGTEPFVYSVDDDIMRTRFWKTLARSKSTDSIPRSRTQSPARRSLMSSRSASHGSIAEVFTTPASSPKQSTTDLSRVRSRRGNALRMTKSIAVDDKTPSAASESPIQRIKSLSDFHLYLSPSRLAHIDLLADSDDEVVDESLTIRGRKRRPALRCVTQPTKGPLRQLKASESVLSEEHARSYSSSLQRHHAKGLETYAIMVAPQIEPAEATSDAVSSVSNVDNNDDNPEVNAQPIAPFARNQNPWFGYPAMRVVDASSDASVLRPRYRRNRKRDLVKTLLFLFVMRLQSVRAWLEKALGVRALAAVIFGRSHQPSERASGPVEGLRRQSMDTSRAMVKNGPEKDWLYMAVGFLLLRGDWVRTVLLAPLELLYRLKTMTGIC